MKYQYGRWVAVAYLANLNGSIIYPATLTYAVDSGNAVIDDFRNNEFDPARLVGLDSRGMRTFETIGSYRRNDELSKWETRLP